MSDARPDGGAPATGRSRFDPEEFRRRNTTALTIDLLYLFATAFLATLWARGLWPGVIAALPLAAMLYFAWRSSTAFLVANVLAVFLSVLATAFGVMPL